MNILLLCKRHYTGHDLLKEKFGRLYHFPRQWANSDHHVTVVAADYRGLRRDYVSEPNLDFIAAPLLAVRQGFSKEIRKLVNQKRPDLVIASCDSHFGFIGLRLARKLEVPFVFDLYHNYEDFGSNRIPGMRNIYNKALEYADLVVCDSEALASRVASRSRRIHIAPQATDGTLFRALDRNTCRRELGLKPEQSILVYVGSIDSRFDSDTVIFALDELEQRGIDSTLVIAGPRLDRRMRDHSRVHYLGRLPQGKIPRVIACADLCLIPYRRTELSETCNPCKLSEYIACERAIVASDVSNIAQYLPKSGHLCYEPGETDSLLSSISQQLKSPIVESSETALLWKDVAVKYLDQLEKLADDYHPL